jgi:uncharacterized protein (DUF433 family)
MIQINNGEPCIRDTQFAVRQLRTLLKNTKVEDILASYPYLTKEDIEYVRATTDDEIALSLLPQVEVIEPIIEVDEPIVEEVVEQPKVEEPTVENGLDEIGKKAEPQKAAPKKAAAKAPVKKAKKK